MPDGLKLTQLSLQTTASNASDFLYLVTNTPVPKSYRTTVAKLADGIKNNVFAQDFSRYDRVSTAVEGFSGNWDTAYQTSLSAPLWNSTYTTTRACSAKWDETASIVDAGGPDLVGDVTSSGGTTTYSNIVPANKGGAGTITGILKANGYGLVTAAVPGTDISVLTQCNTIQLAGLRCAVFDNIPSTAKRITVTFDSVSMLVFNYGTPRIQVGDATKIYTSNYYGSTVAEVGFPTTDGSTAGSQWRSGAVINTNVAGADSNNSGIWTLIKNDNRWVIAGTTGQYSNVYTWGRTAQGGGNIAIDSGKSLCKVVFAISQDNPANNCALGTFDSGAVNIMWE